MFLLETIKVEKQQLQNIFWHNQRLNEARKALFKSSNIWDLRTFIQLPNDLTDAVYKCRVTYSTIIHNIEFERYFPKNIETLKVIEANEMDYSFKYANRDALQYLHQQKGDCDDILIIKNGLITDTSYCNIAFFDGKTWFTPDTPLLNGTKRRQLLQEKKLQERRISIEDLKEFQSFRVFNAMMIGEVQPIALGIKKNI